MDRRSFVVQSLAGAVSILVKPHSDLELKIELTDGDVLCDTGSGVLVIGSYQITFSGTVVNVEFWMDDIAADRIVTHLKSKGFTGSVTLSE